MKLATFDHHRLYSKVIVAFIFGLTTLSGLGSIKREGIMPTAKSSTIGRLSVNLKTDKATYGLADTIVIYVTLTNESTSPIYIYKTLDLGLGAGLSMSVKDAVSGDSVPVRFIADALPPPPSSKDSFTEILPYQSYGVSLPCTMQELNILAKGIYELEIKYQSPVPHDMGFGLPIWSKERKAVASNIVKIAVNH